jgi:hypothetical protein
MMTDRPKHVAGCIKIHKIVVFGLDVLYFWLAELLMLNALNMLLVSTEVARLYWSIMHLQQLRFRAVS